jgi:hypothetical protein
VNNDEVWSLVKRALRSVLSAVGLAVLEAKSCGLGHQNFAVTAKVATMVTASNASEDAEARKGL